jgi:type III restriction enzyme
VEILVINIDSFAKDTNVINTLKETGVRPIEYIQATQPIVIVDEPQNMETDIRKAAIHNLNPLCTLRYSATHKNLYNLVYNLNPVQAYDLGLVKQIEVDGITSDSNYNAAFVQFKGIVPGKKTIKVKLGIYANDKGGVKPKDITCEVGADLYRLSEQRDIYKDGFIITNISAEHGEMEFSNGLVIREGQAQGGLTDEVMKYQIKRTVQAHLDKVKRLQPKGIKVLSLFFIDRVASYREYDEQGNGNPGKFAIWFEEAFTELTNSPRYKGLLPFEVKDVHNGYFSQDKKGTFKDSKEGKSTKDDEDIYGLIMERKEQLLSLETPLQFIFSHSALREGWDNPNVFQICTLNERKSDMTKRQEIGRGLRLPVNSRTGERIMDKNINVLTVVANETYEDFANSLQTEIENETSISFKGKIKNARDKGIIRRNKELTLENFPLLFEIWQKISQKTKYNVEYKTEDLINGTVAELNDPTKVPPTKRPMLEARKARLNYSEEGIEGELKETGREYTQTIKYQIPDVYGYIQSRIDITRTTILEILKQSGR